MTLSVVIVNYNTIEVTSNCLKSIYNFEYDFELEVVIVDNASRNKEAELLMKRFPKSKFICNKENVGFGIACNQGMGLASGEYILLLNSDTIVNEFSISKPLNFLKNDLNYDVLGCRIVDEDGNYQASALGGLLKENWIQFIFSQFSYSNPLIVKIFRLLNNNYGNFNNSKPIEELEKVTGITGCYILLRAEVYTITRGFDPDFFLYCEETEWFRNRIANRFNVVYYPYAEIIHLGGKSSDSQYFNIQNYISNYLYWYKIDLAKYWIYVFVQLINFISSCFLIFFMKKKSKKVTREFIFAFLKTLPIALFNIPKYSRSYGSRLKPLRIN